MHATLKSYMERPWFPRLLLFFAVVAAAFAFGLSDTLLGRALLPAIAGTTGAEGGLVPRLLIAIVLSVIVVLDVALLGLLSKRAQILAVWGQLLALFLIFFYSFNLSYEFIAARIELLVFTGAVTTVYISMLSIVAACFLALLAALARLSSSGLAYGAATFYISFFRGTPLIVQIFLIYSGLPQLGVVLDAVPSGVIALSLCYGAYMAEIFRAGIQGVPTGQREAAEALGLREGPIFRKIVFPQAMRLIIPPTGNQFIAMLKDSSLVSFMGVWELFYLAKTQARSEFKPFEMFITVAIMYWILSIVFELIQARIEAHYGRSARARK
jgi:polar amino acid transport system permease protein